MSMWTQVALTMDMYAWSASDYSDKFVPVVDILTQWDAGVGAQDCFFLGNVTTLRNYISR